MASPIKKQRDAKLKKLQNLPAKEQVLAVFGEAVGGTVRWRLFSANRDRLRRPLPQAFPESWRRSVARAFKTGFKSGCRRR